MFFRSKTYDVVGLGRSYVDVFCSVPKGFAERFGLLSGNGLRVSTARLQDILREASASGVEYIPGGSVANTMAGVASLGGKAGFFGKFLRDRYGKVFARDMKARGIDLLCKPESGVEHSLYAPALCIIVQEPDEKTYMAYDPGCSDNFSARDFAKTDFSKIGYFVVETHSLRDSPFRNDIVEAVKKARTQGCKSVFTLHDISSWWLHQDLAKDVIAPLADIILCSREEMKEFKNIQPIPVDGRQLVITTLEADGSYAHTGEGLVHVPTRKAAKIKNAVGAGDQYLAGLLVGLARGMPLKKSMELATQNAVAILQERGARPHITARPTADHRNLLGRHVRRAAALPVMR